MAAVSNSAKLRSMRHGLAKWAIVFKKNQKRVCLLEENTLGFNGFGGSPLIRLKAGSRGFPSDGA